MTESSRISVTFSANCKKQPRGTPRRSPVRSTEEESRYISNLVDDCGQRALLCKTKNLSGSETGAGGDQRSVVDAFRSACWRRSTSSSMLTFDTELTTCIVITESDVRFFSLPSQRARAWQQNPFSRRNSRAAMSDHKKVTGSLCPKENMRVRLSSRATFSLADRRYVLGRRIRRRQLSGTAPGSTRSWFLNSSRANLMKRPNRMLSRGSLPIQRFAPTPHVPSRSG